MTQDFIPYGRHTVEQGDIDAVVDVIENRFLTQGDCVSGFQADLCQYTGAKFCTTTNSGTSALHVACLAAGVGDGDIVWTVPNSFVASANCADNCGAEVDFVDIDPSTRNLDVTALAEKLGLAASQNKLPKALVAVHFAGLSCDMKTIQQLTSRYQIMLIEDAAHALGGSYLERPVGCCQYSDMVVFSFHPVKSVTTAEGGAVMTNNPDLHHKLQLYANIGITKQQEHFVNDDKAPWMYEQQVLGFNYRLSDVHAVLGSSQLKRLDQYIGKRRELAARYQSLLEGLPLVLPTETSYSGSAWHLYVIELLEHDRKRVFAFLRDAGIGVNVHYIPIHTQPFYQAKGFKWGDFPNSEHYYRNAISIPLYPGLSGQQQDYVVAKLKEVLA